MPEYTLDVELVIKLDQFRVEADTKAEAMREAKAAARDVGMIVDYSITDADDKA